MLKNIKFQYYENSVNSSIAMGFVTLDRFIESIKNPKLETRELLKKIQIAANDNDNKLKSKLKEGLYAFTPDVIVKRKRTYEDVLQYTGLAVLDFDKINNSVEFKEYLFNEYKCIIAAWLSPSKKGVKALIKMPIVKTKPEFKEYSHGISAEMEIYKGFDIAINNAVLLLYIGWDKEILIRDNPETWIVKGIKKSSFDMSKVKEFKISGNITTKQTDWVINWYSETINAINDNGHPQLRDNSVSLGGYVSGGYISLFDAFNLSESLITQNSYLQKGISGYIKTAKQAIQLGTSKPLIFGQ